MLFQFSNLIKPHKKIIPCPFDIPNIEEPFFREFNIKLYN